MAPTSAIPADRWQRCTAPLDEAFEPSSSTNRPLLRAVRGDGAAAREQVEVSPKRHRVHFAAPEAPDDVDVEGCESA